MSYSQSEKYTQMGREIIDELFPELKNIDIAFISCEKEKAKHGKVTLADCRKVPEMYSWCCPYDFMITVYEPNVSSLSDEQLRILLEHELLHVGRDKDEMYVRPHDYEEFKKIIDKYGLEWAKTEEIDYAMLD